MFFDVPSGFFLAANCLIFLPAQAPAHHYVLPAKELERQINPTPWRPIRFEADGSIHMEPLQPPHAAITCMAASADGSFLLAANGNQAVSLIDGRTGKKIRQIIPANLSIQVWAVSLSPDGKNAACCLRSALGDVPARDRVAISDIPTRRLRLTIVGRANCAAYGPDGNWLAIGGEKGVEIWDLTKQKPTNSFISLRPASPDQADVDCLAVSPDGKRIALGMSGQVALHDRATGKLIWRQSIEGNAGSLCFSPDGYFLASTESTHLRRAGFCYKSTYVTLTLSGKNKYTEPPSKVKLWEAATGLELLVAPAEGSEIGTVAFSPSARLLAFPDGANVKVWDLAQGKMLKKFDGHGAWTSGVAFCPHSQRLACAGNEGMLFPNFKEHAILPLLPRWKPEDDKLDELLVEMASGDDGPRVLSALWALAAVPARTVPVLRARLQPIAPVSQRCLAKLIADLDSVRFQERCQAVIDLEKLGELAEPALRRALAETASPEVSRSAMSLLDKLPCRKLSPKALFEHRSIVVLARIGTPQARNLLAKLAKGAPEARLTQEARETLQRLSR